MALPDPIIATPGTIRTAGRAVGSFYTPVHQHNAGLADRPEGVQDESQIYYIAAWNGHKFEAIEAHVRSIGEQQDNGVQYWRWQIAIRYAGRSRYDLHEAAMDVHLPVDPRMHYVDVHGATRAYPNADNTGWLFAHTDQGTHHDYELTLLAAVDGVFQPLFRQYQVDELTATNDTNRDRAKASFVLISAFYGRVVTEARKLARAPYLGERHQQPHPANGYLDADITAAVEAAKVYYTENPPDNITEYNNALAYINSVLTMPLVETRWDRAARLEAERKAAEKAAAEGDQASQ